MKKKIFSNASVLIIVSVVLSFAVTGFFLYGRILTNMKTTVGEECRFLANAMEAAQGDSAYLKKLCEGIESRVTFIDGTGQVIFESQASGEALDNHGDRPEVIEAAGDGTGSDVRYSDTLAKQTFYYAMKLSDGSVLRVARTTDSVLKNMASGFGAMAVTTLAIIVLAVVLAKKTAKRMVEPLNNLNLNEPLENKIYEELEPLLVRLDKQNKKISEQMERLRQNQEEYLAITEHMKDGLIVMNREVVLSINTAATKLFEVRREECVGHSIVTVSRNEALKAVLASVFAGNDTQRPADIHGRAYHIFGNPVLDSAGNVTGAVIFILDVTEKQKAEMMRREFSANVSHELKTPLMSISGYAEIMKNGLVRPEDMKNFAGRIFDEASRLSTLVGDIIKLSRLDEADGTLPTETVDLYEMACETKEQLFMSAEKNHITVEVSGSSARMTGVPQVLGEMLYNLCDNAIKYNRPGGHVWMDVRCDGDCVVLKVADDGIGIAKEHQERIFERFYRVDKSHSKETGGTGLGLSIVKHGAMLHNAGMDIESTPGQGTRLKFIFPKGQQCAPIKSSLTSGVKSFILTIRNVPVRDRIAGMDWLFYRKTVNPCLYLFYKGRRCVRWSFLKAGRPVRGLL